MAADGVLDVGASLDGDDSGNLEGSSSGLAGLVLASVWVSCLGSDAVSLNIVQALVVESTVASFISELLGAIDELLF